jgi:hypothetical protein
MAEQLATQYNEIFGLVDKDVRLGLWQAWYAERPLVDVCQFDDIDRCVAIEASIDTFEGQVIDRVQAMGLEVYQKVDLTTERPMEDWRPRWQHFDGLFVELNPATDTGNAVDQTDDYVLALSNLGDTIGPSHPVYLSPWSGPMRFYLASEFCEAEICASAFEDYYTFNETVFDAAMTHLTSEQLKGFGIALFDGKAFDIRDPHEADAAFQTNRTGETLMNNPLLNLYLTQP